MRWLNRTGHRARRDRVSSGRERANRVCVCVCALSDAGAWTAGTRGRTRRIGSFSRRNTLGSIDCGRVLRTESVRRPRAIALVGVVYGDPSGRWEQTRSPSLSEPSTDDAVTLRARSLASADSTASGSGPCARGESDRCPASPKRSTHRG